MFNKKQTFEEFQWQSIDNEEEEEKEENEKKERKKEEASRGYDRKKNVRDEIFFLLT